MIHSVKFTDGFPLDIKSMYDENKTVLDQTFEFKPGLNVIFGPNGCGKSTLINAITTHGLTVNGWSNINIGPFQMERGFNPNGDDDYSIRNYFERRMKCIAEVDIDGPVYFVNPGVTENEHDGYRDGQNLGDNTLSVAAELVLRMEKSTRSTGEFCMSHQGQILTNLMDGTWSFNPDSIRNMYEYRKDMANSNWAACAKVVYDYASTTVLKGGAPTIVLDEPEEHLSFEIAVGLFQNIIPTLIKRGYQVIVATHFILAPFMVKDTNVISIDRNLDKMKDYLLGVIGGKIAPVDPDEVELPEHDAAQSENLPEDYLEIDAVVRYPEDAMVDGEQDSNPYRMPFLVKEKNDWHWKPKISMSDGKILNWPEGTKAYAFYKVCDECSIKYMRMGGNYLDSWQKDDYVPDFLCLDIDSDPDGDYIALDIEKDGSIKNWDSTTRIRNFNAWCTFAKH